MDRNEDVMETLTGLVTICADGASGYALVAESFLASGEALNPKASS